MYIYMYTYIYVYIYMYTYIIIYIYHKEHVPIKTSILFGDLPFDYRRVVLPLVLSGILVYLEFWAKVTNVQFSDQDWVDAWAFPTKY